MSKERAYSFVSVPVRPPKPREKGLTMVLDFAEPLGDQEDILQAVGEYIDMAKIAAFISTLLPKDYLKKKIELYQKYDVVTWPGGMFLETALMQDKSEEYFKETKELGYDALEVSDNIVTIPMEEKTRLIEVAAKDYDFKVVAEIGKKEFGATSAQAMIAEINRCFDAGAWKVILEAKEFFSEKLETTVVDAIYSVIPAEKILFELPDLMFHGVHEYDQREVIAWLINKFGPDVNIANVRTWQIIHVEEDRNGLSPYIFGTIGVYKT